MNFYKHYIGDFQRDTGHLSLTERGAYLSLMHHYYATEKPLPDDHPALCRIAGAITKVERDAVKAVMAFFERVESGLMHNRIEAELHKAGEIANTNRDIAVAREAKRRAEREAREEHEACTNRATNVPRIEHEQSTHQTPDSITRTPLPPAGGDVKPQAVKAEPPGFKTFWADWPKSERKGGKAKCLSVWLKAGLEESAPVILAHLAVMKTSPTWRKEEGQYIPAPLAYLNGRKWDGADVQVESSYAGAV